MDPTDPDCPIRKQALPSARELVVSGGSPDPLHEEDLSPVPGLVHRYPDRVALCVSTECAMYCRHCLRRRFVGAEDDHVTVATLRAGMVYLRQHPEIRDVLLTGGDPLLLSDRKLESILRGIRAIEHVEIIRIGSRVPCTLPQRITPRLVEMLSRYHPVWLNTQFNHPRELTPQAAEACDRLLRAGIPVGNQSVLLAGVNDDPAIIRNWCKGWFACGCARITSTNATGWKARPTSALPSLEAWSS